MKIFDCTNIHYTNDGKGFTVNGDIKLLNEFLPQLKAMSGFNKIKTAPLDSSLHIVFFDDDTTDIEFANAQCMLAKNSNLETDMGLASPELVGWRWLYKQFGLSLITQNWGRVLFYFISSRFIAGNEGFNRIESIILMVFHALIMCGLLRIITFTTSSFISIGVGVLLLFMLSSALSNSLPPVGDIPENGFADDGIKYLRYLVLIFFIGSAIAPTIVVASPALAFILMAIISCWLVFRACTYKGTRTYL